MWLSNSSVGRKVVMRYKYPDHMANNKNIPVILTIERVLNEILL